MAILIMLGSIYFERGEKKKKGVKLIFEFWMFDYIVDRSHED